MKIPSPVAARLLPATLLPIALGGALATGGCGSSKTQTVSVSSSTASPRATSPATGQRTAPGPPSSSAKPSTGGTGSGTHASRTAPGPAFVAPSGSPEGARGLAGALATVRAHGYAAADASQYRPADTLRVLVGTRTGSGEGNGQQAFFFVNERYIGTDTSEPSAAVKVLGQSDTEVTLAYSLYRAHDPLCCPSGGQARVRFALDNGRLTPLDPIPPTSSASDPSRR